MADILGAVVGKRVDFTDHVTKLHKILVKHPSPSLRVLPGCLLLYPALQCSTAHPLQLLLSGKAIALPGAIPVFLSILILYRALTTFSASNWQPLTTAAS